MTPSQQRMALSLVAEPGDPRMTELLQTHEPGRVLEAVCAGKRLTGASIPQAWVERGHELERTIESVRVRAARDASRWVVPGDTDWPDQLADLDHVPPLQGATGQPLGLWVRGKGDLAELTARSVAVVGARDCTTYGAECAFDVAADTTDAGFTVISGAAFGIDGSAHRGALAMLRPTVAVLACGVDVEYPKAHAALLAHIADDGLIVSEQAPGEAPLKNRFLSRNRLIAALSLGTVVIEAESRSGSLNTLNWADQLGRVSMALPGPVTSTKSAGAHAALRSGQAVLVTSGADVVEELSGLGAAAPEPEPLPLTEFDLLPEPARRTLDGLDWASPRSVSQIASASRLSTRQVGQALVVLERRGFAGRLDSGWILVRRADVG